MRKAIKWGGIIYIICQIAVWRGFNQSTDEDYMVIDATQPPAPKPDTLYKHKIKPQPYDGNEIPDDDRDDIAH